MKNSIIFIIILTIFTACSKNEAHYNGEALLKEKCSLCHNLDMPPKTYKDEKAPPMMAVAFHVKDFLKVNSPSDKKPKFIDFFQDYVLYPSIKKAFCDKESLKSYGLMPSQKGNVNKDEIKAIAEYIYDYYDQKKFLTLIREKASFEALSEGERLATQKGCLTCHAKDKAKVAPSFKDIAKKSDQEIAEVIKYGSKGKWKGFERMTMPAYEIHLNQNEVDTILKWIKSI